MSCNDPFCRPDLFFSFIIIIQTEKIEEAHFQGFFLRNLSHLYMLQYIKNTYLGNKQYSTNMSRTENSISIFVCHHRRKIFFLQGQVVINIFIIIRKMKLKDILHNQTTPNYYFFGENFDFIFEKQFKIMRTIDQWHP